MIWFGRAAVQYGHGKGVASGVLGLVQWPEEGQMSYQEGDKGKAREGRVQE